LSAGAKPIKEEIKKTNNLTKKETEVVKTIKVEKPVITQPVETTILPEKTPKTHSKENRYNFFVNNELNEYVSNITWIKRQKNVAMYMNSLIKKDLLDFLNLPAESTDEELTTAWNTYKKENNI